MAALSADTVRALNRDKGWNWQVKTSSVCYSGGMQAVNGGYAKPYAAAAGDVPVGIFDGTAFYGDAAYPTTYAGGVTGNSAATNPPSIGFNWDGTFVQSLAVTGVAAVTDTFKLVYATTDNDFTLTPPATNACAIGFVASYVSAGVAHVFVFGPALQFVMGLLGSAVENVLLGLIDFASAGAATLHTQTMAYHGKILSTFAVPVVVATGAAGTVSVQPKIGGAALTTNGGLLTLATGDALGTNKAGAAVTDDGTNEFHKGSALTLVGSSPGGAQTTGLYEFWAVIQRLPGA